MSHNPYLCNFYFYINCFAYLSHKDGILLKLFFVCYRSIISDIQRDNRVVSISTRAGIRNALVTILDQLQRCQKSLNEFLEVYICIYVNKKKELRCKHYILFMCYRRSAPLFHDSIS